MLYKLVCLAMDCKVSMEGRLCTLTNQITVTRILIGYSLVNILHYT